MSNLIDKQKLLTALNTHLTKIKEDETTDSEIIESYSAIIEYIEGEPTIEISTEIQFKDLPSRLQDEVTTYAISNAIATVTCDYTTGGYEVIANEQVSAWEPFENYDAELLEDTARSFETAYRDAWLAGFNAGHTSEKIGVDV